MNSAKCLIPQCKMDHKLFNDEQQILANLLKLEENYLINGSYFTRLESKIDASMRYTLVTWMLEVCEEQKCTDDVFSLAVNIFDRLMCIVNKVEKYHLQLFGTVCLFIASKLKSNCVSKLNALQLIEYTDNSITLEELLEWELVILDKLKWDVAAICPNDFLEFYLHRLVNCLNLDKEQIKQLKKHCYAFTALCSTDFKFAFYPASLIAAACVLSALNGLFAQAKTFVGDASSVIVAMTDVDVECLFALKEMVDDLFTQSFATNTKQAVSSQASENKSIEFEDDYEIIEEEYYNMDFIDTEEEYDSEESKDSRLSFGNNNYYTYEQLISGVEQEEDDYDPEFNPNNASTNSQLKKLKFTVTSDSLFDCINELNLNSDVKENGRKEEAKMSKAKRGKGRRARKSSSSSTSSGVSSTTSAFNCYSQMTPPLANLLPMPTFSGKKSKKSTRSSNYMNNLVMV